MLCIAELDFEKQEIFAQCKRKKYKYLSDQPQYQIFCLNIIPRKANIIIFLSKKYIFSPHLDPLFIDLFLKEYLNLN